MRSSSRPWPSGSSRCCGGPRATRCYRCWMERLPDGSFLSELVAAADKHHREGVLGVRVVEYTIDDGGRPGASGTTYRLLTNVLDPADAPADELAALYAQRWEIESISAGPRPGSMKETHGHVEHPATTRRCHRRRRHPPERARRSPARRSRRPRTRPRPPGRRRDPAAPAAPVQVLAPPAGRGFLRAAICKSVDGWAATRRP